MALYLVTLDPGISGLTLPGGHDSCLVSAESETEAKQVASAQNDSDGNCWLNNSTAEALAPAADWEGWRVQIKILDATPIVVEYTAEAGDGVDEIAAGLVAALNATTPIAGAAWSAPTLKLAETTDNLGDNQATVDVYPPGKANPIAALVGTITDGGAANAALTAVLNLDDANIPTYHRGLKQ